MHAQSTPIDRLIYFSSRLFVLLLNLFAPRSMMVMVGFGGGREGYDQVQDRRVTDSRGRGQKGQKKALSCSVLFYVLCCSVLTLCSPVVVVEVVVTVGDAQGSGHTRAGGGRGSFLCTKLEHANINTRPGAGMVRFTCQHTR